MLGIAMNENTTDKGNEQLSNDLQSPQRSILDFFKSPDKIKPAKKPTSLLSYFGTAQQKEEEQKQLKKSLNGVEKQNGDHLDKKVDKGTGKKRKQKDRETEKNNTDDFEEEQSGKGKKRKKCGEKLLKKTEGIDKEEDEKTANHLVNGNIDKKGIHLGSMLESEKEFKSKDKEKTAKSVSEDKEAGDQQDKSNSKNQKVKKTSKSVETKKKSSEQKDKRIGDTTTSKESKGVENVVNESDVTSESKETVSEMCYEDFIKSLGESVSKTDDDKDVKTDVTDKTANDKTEENDKAGEENEESTESKEDLYIKSYPTISSFFSKVDKTHAPAVPTDPKVLGQVTIKVDIHSEPSLNNKRSNHVQIKASPLYPSKVEEEIEIISSEVVTIDCTPTSKKSLFGVKNDAYDVECEKFKDTNESLAETLSSCEDSCMSEDSSVCVVEEVEDVSIMERKKCFLQSGTVPEISTKATQRTLSFSKAGLQVQKPVKPTHSTRVRKKDSSTLNCDPVFESTPVKKNKPGKKPKKTFDLDEDKENKTTKKLPGKKSTKDRGKKTSAKQEGEDVCDRRKSLRSRYRVAIIGADDGKRTPIRMKFNRYSKSSSSGVEEGDNFTPRSSNQAKKNHKLSKAKELLEKAKQKNTRSSKVQRSSKQTKRGAKNDTESSDDAKPAVGRRRSSRLSDKISKESVVILDSEGSEDEVDGCSVKTPKAKNKTKTKGNKTTQAKSTPNKGTPNKRTPSKGGGKTPSKKTAKLASIFMSGKAAKEKKPAVVLDPEAEKLKRAFLMSGVPEELRRQSVTTEVMIIEDYPPLPTINHTQQREPDTTNRHGVKLWDLEKITLPKLGEDVQGLPNKSVEWRQGLVRPDSNIYNSSRIKEFKKHPRIEDGDVEKILAEISSYCPTYPVRKVFSVLKMKKDDFDQEAEQLENKTENPTAEEKKKEEKVAPRRSLRKRVSLELPQVVELGGSPLPQSTGNAPSTEDNVNKQETVPTVSWTDKYLPLHSSEVVGNTAKVRKLQSWLVEWKQRLDKEARKAKKLQMKQNKGKQSKESGNRDDWWGDDSDFDLDSDDDDDEDRLCNTAMLCGPSGIGKTAAVYGLAHELGFKVFEVNASSTRNGKRILAQLQEATQSHQVSRGNDTPTKCPPSKLANALQSNTKIPSAFSSFFKQTSSNLSNKTALKSLGKEGKGKGKDDKDPSKTKKRKRDSEAAENLHEKTPKKKSRKKEKPDCGVVIDPKADGSLNLSSTSLILFEEVDIVFPSDHGFWSAVQQFMATTKIPIILTTSDAGLVNKFDGRFDHYRFKTPPYRNLAVYLQLICLAENVRTDFWDMYNLMSLCGGDIRRCILSLQYWVISGGGVQSIRRSIQKTLDVQQQLQTNKLPDHSALKPTDIKKDNRASPQKQLSSTMNDDDDDDFVCLKPAFHRRNNRFITDDEESNSMPPVPLRFNQDLVNTGIKDTDSENECLPLVHLGHTTSVQGLVLQGHNNIISLLKQMLEIDDDSLVPLLNQVCHQYRSLKCDLLYRHHLSLLPLTTVESQPLQPTLSTVSNVQKKSHRRIKTFDLYDSETSNDGQDEQQIDCDESQNKTPAKSLNPEESALVGNSLKSFYSFYDNLSLVDSMVALEERSGSKSESDISSDIQLYSCRSLYKTHISMKNDVLSSEHICVPITQDTPRIEELQGKEHVSTSVDTPISRASSNVRTSLPLGLQVNGVHQDYLPTLRAICKSEQLREQAKIKRRFQHYLDSIGLTLKDNTLSVLCTTFR